jgi:hypothetical protein
MDSSLSHWVHTQDRLPLANIPVQAIWLNLRISGEAKWDNKKGGMWKLGDGEWESCERPTRWLESLGLQELRIQNSIA